MSARVAGDSGSCLRSHGQGLRPADESCEALLRSLARGERQLEGGRRNPPSERGHDRIIISGSNYFYFLYGNVIYSFNLFPKHFDLLSFI